MEREATNEQEQQKESIVVDSYGLRLTSKEKNLLSTPARNNKFPMFKGINYQKKVQDQLYLFRDCYRFIENLSNIALGTDVEFQAQKKFKDFLNYNYETIKENDKLVLHYESSDGSYELMKIEEKMMVFYEKNREFIRFLIDFCVNFGYVPETWNPSYEQGYA